MLLAPLFPALPLTVFSCCVLFAPSPPASCVTGLRRGGGGRKGERVKEIKGIPLPFSLPPNPLPFSKQATTTRMPGSGYTFWFNSFVLWVQREYRARLEISYIDFFFKRSESYTFSVIQILCFNCVLLLDPAFIHSFISFILFIEENILYPGLFFASFPRPPKKILSKFLCFVKMLPDCVTLRYSKE